MPRKYHRPPTTAKRRKAKKSTIPYTFEAAPEAENGDVAVDVAEDVLAVPRTPEPLPDAGSPLEAGERPRSAVKHVSRDYSYVRAEVARIVVVAGFLIIALIVTAILRG